MDLAYEYTRKRAEFGKHPNFADTDDIVVADLPPNHDEFKDDWVVRPITSLEIDCIPSVSEHYVNTERFIQVDRGMTHTEGGWPKDVNTQEFSDKQRYLRKIELDPDFGSTAYLLSKKCEESVMQNNSIDMYEDYFFGISEDHSSEPPSAKTIAVLRDPQTKTRPVSKVCWHPDSRNKLAIAHSFVEFQSMDETTPVESYIWDINNPNTPEFTLIPDSPLCTVAFNRKSPEHLVGGCYNGLIAFWDLRRGSKPVEKSLIEHSHNDPVYDIYWIQSRSGSEFCSVSTDGFIHWWDVRKLGSGPMDSMSLQVADDEPPLGGTCLEYRTDAGATRFLIGTENGSVVTIERKAKKDGDSQKQFKTPYGFVSGRHHGPVYSIERNYALPKVFLTVGDWAGRIWMEDVKTPIMSTRYEGTFLTSGCWSPTRPGAFFLTKQDGTVDVWDYFYKQSEPVYSMKVSEQALSTISVQAQGSQCAVGCNDGSTTIVELCHSLVEPSAQEKSAISQMFEREMNREKTLQARLLALKRQKTRKVKPNTATDTIRDSEDGNTTGTAATTTNDTSNSLGGNNNTNMDEVEKEFFKLIEKNKPQKLTIDLPQANDDNDENRNTENLETTTSVDRKSLKESVNDDYENDDIDNINESD